MISTDQIERLLSGGTVVSQAGEKVGKVGQVFLDDRSGEPEWVTVKTGLFGTAESFVPLADADVQGDEIRVPYTKDTVKGAPRVDDSEGHLSLEEEAELYRYYGRSTTSTDDAPSAGETARDEGAAGEGDASDGAARDEGVVGRHAAGPPTDDAATASGGTRPGPGAATGDTYRLRRYVVTEYVTETVPADAVPPAPEPRGTNATRETSAGDESREEHRS
ncbi:PRC-barrel domain-containing protein [Cellulosimicrobium cellulans]|uniref:PRC-barrel domain-containing protein n=1 Tax=Cellulosimicrobium cellulans TaxID=1710 RepID=UPI001964C3DD|nr:PRC-barrel domain-containing protein [Cellulosimicrobium cellulans]MBN0042089.1 PRC-barrel domain-containing protein [Cellulosimicrobium cellulans]